MKMTDEERRALAYLEGKTRSNVAARDKVIGLCMSLAG